MRFFDCNCYFGRPVRGAQAPVATAEELLAEMDRAGVERALVWHIAQLDASPLTGNPLLAEGIRPHPRLTGCWSLLPTHTHECPPPDELFRQMREHRIGALRAFPDAGGYLLNAVTMGDVLEAMQARRVPLLLSVPRTVHWGVVHALLADFPQLTLVICDHGCWGQDRYFRPLLARYPNVYVDTAQYLLDGGIESLVADYGAGRLLFGSGFPESYLGTMMLTLQGSKITPEAKAAIAGGNLERILAEAQL